MNESVEKSDIDKIPINLSGHTRVMRQKNRYFFILFKSSMIEEYISRISI